MGKPYNSELNALDSTYAWSMGAPIEELKSAIARSAAYPLIAVGSGGSLTAANFVSALHQNITGHLSKAVTPLEFIANRFCARDAAVIFLSAGGMNADIVTCFENAILREPARCMAFCLRGKSKLSRTAAKFEFVDFIEATLPTGKDGYLATNSLLAYFIILSRAYSEVFGVSNDLPDVMSQLAPPSIQAGDWQFQLKQLSRPLWKRDTLLVLFSPELQSAAIDIESKFSEAGIGTTQLSDLRNFAHGRHNWLAKREKSSAVLALVSDEDRKLAAKTFALFPNTVPVVTIELSKKGLFAPPVAALISGLYLVGFAGEARKIDPGRPGVPEFGRKIYHLQTSRNFTGVKRRTYSAQDVAVARKLGCDVVVGCAVSAAERGELDKAFNTFLHSLACRTFPALVLDYDGTLCASSERFSGIRREVADRLIKLLKSGITIGIATGRGKSVREDLQKKIPKRFWKRVLVGYYNGSAIGYLGEDQVPESHRTPTLQMKDLATAVNKYPALTNGVKHELRHSQLSLQPSCPGTIKQILDIAQQIIQSFEGVRAVVSSHSVDLLAPSVSKRDLVAQVQDSMTKPSPVLNIGDKGVWPGNDFELLSLPYSLSVDEVSADPDTCWNLAPLGQRGPQAALYYLAALKIARAGVTLDVAKIMSDAQSYSCP
jgi:hydroxymethylpyrimidine pyrophosphatase-like HAD family hydrolase/fructoselysine-6-P-deglycase FrlB-like protein